MNIHDDVMRIVADYEAAMNRNYDETFARIRRRQRRSQATVVAGVALLVLGLVSAGILSAQAQVTVYDRQASHFHVERFKTKRGHEMSISHSRTDGGCRLFLYTTIDGVSIDVLQQIDVRFCQVMQQSPVDAVKKVKP
jgi:hypothetical protein